jgi:TetR/AcrR family transcriptional repressor of nem operon
LDCAIHFGRLKWIAQSRILVMSGDMANDNAARSALTAKGARTRAQIVATAARLVHERGVSGTSLENIRAAADVSSSQLYHYFADKDELVQAVIGYQADAVVTNQEQAKLGTPAGLKAWRNMVIAEAAKSSGQGGCPLGSLGGQLAESDPQARDLVATGFERWSTAIHDGLIDLQIAGQLRADIDPDDLAVTLLAALQGGLLLAQVQRNTRSLETAIDSVLALAAAR